MLKRYECLFMLPRQPIISERIVAHVIREQIIFMEDAEFIEDIDIEYIESDLLKIGINAELHELLFGEGRVISFFKLKNSTEIAGFTWHGTGQSPASSISLFLTPQAFRMIKKGGPHHDRTKRRNEGSDPQH